MSEKSAVRAASRQKHLGAVEAAREAGLPHLTGRVSFRLQGGKISIVRLVGPGVAK